MVVVTFCGGRGSATRRRVVKGGEMGGRPGPFVGERLLTVVEVAAAMRVSNMTVYRLIKAGQLAAIRVGKNYRIRESELDRYLRERVVGR